MKSRWDQVGDDYALAVVVGETEPPRLRLARRQTQLTHQGADQLEPARHVPIDQVGVHPAVPVGAVRVLERLVKDCGLAEPHPLMGRAAVGDRLGGGLVEQRCLAHSGLARQRQRTALVGDPCNETVQALTFSCPAHEPGL